jgi:hypothetical protein
MLPRQVETTTGEALLWLAIVFTRHYSKPADEPPREKRRV